MAKRFRPDYDAAEYKGRYFPYDIIKEGSIAILVVFLLVVGLSTLFGSPDDKEVTFQSWAHNAASDFAMTASSELSGDSGTAGYGPPYNNASDGGYVGPLHLGKIVGVRFPINAAYDFVVYPLSTLADNQTVTTALAQWNAASATQQHTWAENYYQGTQLPSFGFKNGAVYNAATNTGPVPTMINSLTLMARQGGLTAQLIQGRPFYSTDYTKPLMFLADGNYLADRAAYFHLGGDQWGMMNETGAYPGQAWLWLYTMLYQIPPYSTTWADNADAAVWATMMILTVLFILVPFIPGLRSIPRWTKVYRLIWREHYRGSK
jgi:hypothetical protein